MISAGTFAAHPVVVNYRLIQYMLEPIVRVAFNKVVYARKSASSPKKSNRMKVKLKNTYLYEYVNTAKVFYLRCLAGSDTPTGRTYRILIGTAGQLTRLNSTSSNRMGNDTTSDSILNSLYVVLT